MLRVARLSAATAIAWGIFYYAFGALLAPMRSDLGASEAAVAAAFSIALLAGGLAASPVGRLIDRVGARPVMLVSAATGTLALLAVAAARDLVTFYLGWALVGASQAGTLYEPAFAAITRWYPDVEARGRALLLLTVVGGFASTVFVPLASWLARELGWRGALMVLAMLVATTALPLFASLPTSPGVLRRAHARSRSPRVLLLAGVLGVQSFASAGLAVHLVSHLTAADVAHASALAGAMGAAQVPARVLYHPVSRVGSAGGRLAVLLLLQAAALFALGGRGPTLIAGVLVFGATSGVVTLERATIVAEWFGVEEYGAVSGRVASCALAARAAAPVALGLLRESAFAMTAALLVVAAAVTLAASIPRPLRL